MSSNGIYASDSSCVYKPPVAYQSDYKFKNSYYLPYSYCKDLDVAKTYLELSSTIPNCLWGAKNVISDANLDFLNRYSPYSKVHTYAKGRTYYSYTDPMSFFKLRAPSMDDLAAKYSVLISVSANESIAKKISNMLSDYSTIGRWLTSSSISAESKEQVKDSLACIRDFSKDLNSYMTSDLDNDSITDLLMGLQADVEALKDELDVLDADLKAEEQANKESKAAEVASGAGSGTGGGSVLGSGGGTSVSAVEGDVKMNDAQLATRYGLKAPVTKELSSSYAANITNAADSRGSFTTALTALDNKNTAAFLVSLSDDNIASFCEDIDGQSFWDDDDEKSIKEFLAKFDGALDLLKGAGYLTIEEYDRACRLVADSKREVKDSFKDTARNNVVNNLKQLKGILSTQVDGVTVVKGSQDHFAQLVKEKQETASTEAIKNFRKDYVSSMSGSENAPVFEEDANYRPLPEEIKYLPNKDAFQVKLEGKVFIGKTISEINSKIAKCNDESIIMSWVELKKELLLKSTS